MKTFQDCKDEVIEVEYGLTWDDWLLHHELPKGRFVKEYEQQSADLYASQFKIHLSPDRILTQEEFNKQYQHYQELLNLEDVAGFWKENFDMANAERNKLKESTPVTTEPTEEEIKDGERNWHNRTIVKNQLITWIAAIDWYKAKIGRS